MAQTNSNSNPADQRAQRSVLAGVALPDDGEVSASVNLEFPNSGGHVGFVSGGIPGTLDWLPQRIMWFFAATLTI